MSDTNIPDATQPPPAAAGDTSGIPHTHLPVMGRLVRSIPHQGVFDQKDDPHKAGHDGGGRFVSTYSGRPPRKRNLTPVLLTAPLLLFMVIFYTIPVLTMLFRSVDDPTWTLSNYAALAHDTVFHNVFLTTVRTAATVTVGCLLLGYPVALTLIRPGRSAFVALIIVLLPFWTSILVRSYAWMVILGRHGLLNEALVTSGIIDHPLRLLNTPIAVHVAMIHILLPYMILPIANALRQIDPSLARAALSLGASPAGAFRQVTLPLSMPGVAAGILLVFVLSLGFYITPALVGGAHDMTIAMLIADQVDQLNWPYAACLSAALLVTTLAILALFHRLFGVGTAFRTTAR